MQLDEATLRRLWPRGDTRMPGLLAGIAKSSREVFARYGITTPNLVAHVMAQISHECGAGRDIVENLNYTAARMTQVWPSRFPTLASAQLYAGNPRALANKVYNGRMGNRTGSDDGWNFRGRGGAQTTGRDGYQRVKKATGLDVVAQPELLIDPAHFLNCAVSDFINCGCLSYAEADDVVGVTRRLNGGTIGLAERKVWLAKWKRELAGRTSTPVIESPPLAPDVTAAKQSAVASIIAALIAAFRRA
jgi:putative chitinase